MSDKIAVGLLLMIGIVYLINIISYTIWHLKQGGGCEALDDPP